MADHPHVEITYELGGAVLGLVLDAAPSQKHSREVDVTEHPVETGAAVTDHVRQKPRSLQIEGVSLDVNAYDTLNRMMDDARLLTVRTTTETYEQMILSSLTVPRDATTGDVLRFSATFRRILFAETKRATIQIPKAKKVGGTKTGTPTSDATKAQADKSKSFLSQLSDWAGRRRR